MPADPSPFTTDATVFGQVTLTWGSVSGVDGYRVYRKRSGGTYVEILDTTDLSYVDITAAYDLDTLGTIGIESWDYKVVSYDSGGESTGLEQTGVTMDAQAAADITNTGIKDPTYNDGSDQTATYTITNPDTVTATVSDGSKLIHEERARKADAYAGGEAN